MRWHCPGHPTSSWVLVKLYISLQPRVQLHFCVNLNFMRLSISSAAGRLHHQSMYYVNWCPLIHYSSTVVLCCKLYTGQAHSGKYPGSANSSFLMQSSFQLKCIRRDNDFLGINCKSFKLSLPPRNKPCLTPIRTLFRKPEAPWGLRMPIVVPWLLSDCAPG